MQEQKIITAHYLVIQNTYEEIEVGLYNKDQLLDKINIHKNEASKTLLIHIGTLLNSHNLKINNLNFIGVNKGPGPFTTLRTVIATVNAINFAIGIPLIGINGLDAFISEYSNPEWPVTVVMLNAFNNDVYYALQNDKQIDKGAKNINVLLQELNSLGHGERALASRTIRFLGNGTKLFETQIKDVFGDLAYIPESNPNTCSIDSTAALTYQKWLKNEIEEQVTPLYIKDAIKINQ